MGPMIGPAHLVWISSGKNLGSSALCMGVLIQNSRNAWLIQTELGDDFSG